MYNKCVIDVDLATLYIDVVKCYDNVKIYAPYGSVVSKIAKENGYKIDYEVFLVLGGQKRGQFLVVGF